MLKLSDVMLRNPDMESFRQLIEAVREGARQERFLRIDIKPPYPDTPANWEDVLEGAFSGVLPS